jgi:hypothetical protein
LVAYRNWSSHNAVLVCFTPPHDLVATLTFWEASTHGWFL